LPPNRMETTSPNNFRSPITHMSFLTPEFCRIRAIWKNKAMCFRLYLLFCFAGMVMAKARACIPFSSACVDQ
jgi:hypothetical protein